MFNGVQVLHWMNGLDLRASAFQVPLHMGNYIQLFSRVRHRDHHRTLFEPSQEDCMTKNVVYTELHMSWLYLHKLHTVLAQPASLVRYDMTLMGRLRVEARGRGSDEPDGYDRDP